MGDKFVIDTNSLRIFFRYYYFDRKNGNVLYDKLYKFIINKVKSNEIIIIDKVIKELPGKGFFKRDTKGCIEPTLAYYSDVEDLMQKYYIKENEKFYNFDQNQIQIDLDKAQDIDADLYMVAHCIHLNNSGDNAYLITEETDNTNYYKKLIHKIPIICKKDNENINCKNIAYLLFDYYKDVLKFSLDII